MDAVLKFLTVWPHAIMQRETIIMYPPLTAKCCIDRSQIAPMPRSIQNFCAGNITRSTLLNWLLPFSLASFSVTVSIGILIFPGPYDWRTRVISHVLSPRYNPAGCWVPSIGFALAALLSLPFAGYLEQRLSSITPCLARWARWAFTLGFLLVWGVVVSQNIGLGHRWRWLHETLARMAAAATAVGIVCCGLCALRDQLGFLGGRQMLRRRLALCWVALMIVPSLCGAFGLILLFGRLAEHPWAMQARALLRPTMLWQLAFWEWVGVVLVFGLMFFSVVWLPEQVHSPANLLVRRRQLLHEPERRRNSGLPVSVLSN